MTFDVWINGEQVANDVHDYYKICPKGTLYEVSDIKVTADYLNAGDNTYSGTMDDNVNVILIIAEAYIFDANVMEGKDYYSSGHDEMTFDVFLVK